MPNSILIVDDDRAFREELKECLFNYDVVEAADGEQAIELINSPNEIDVVILDVMMPKLSGTEALKRIKKAAPEVGIIVLTGYSSKDIAIEALKGKADDYMEKPVAIEKLKGTIEKLLENKNRTGEIGSETVEGKINRVKNFAARNWHKRICLEEAASKVYLSSKYLSRIFRQTVGMNYSEFCLEVKTEKAKELLDKTGCNIDQISDKLGYKNTESFIRTFKKRTGSTPTQYRSNSASKSSGASRNGKTK
jgi:two-component system, response regulator YesN